MSAEVPLVPLSSLSIGIACYNDAPTIQSVVDGAAEVAARLSHRFTVLVVDDGSSDGSPELLRDLSQQRPWLECRYHEVNKGFGATFRTLYGNTSCDYNAILPGDDQLPPDQLEPMAARLSDHDLVLGWRRDRADNTRRQLSSALYNGLVSLVAGTTVRDVNSISIARTALTRRLELASRSAFVHAEFFLECRRLGARSIEVPIRHRTRVHGLGSGGKLSTAVATFTELLRYAVLGVAHR